MVLLPRTTWSVKTLFGKQINTDKFLLREMRGMYFVFGRCVCMCACTRECVRERGREKGRRGRGRERVHLIQRIYMLYRNLGRGIGNKLVSIFSVLCIFVPKCHSFSDNYIALSPGTMKSSCFYSIQSISFHLSEKHNFSFACIMKGITVIVF